MSENKILEIIKTTEAAFRRGGMYSIQLYVTSRLFSSFLYTKIKLTVTIKLKIVEIALIQHHTAQPTLIQLHRERLTIAKKSLKIPKG